MNEVSELTLQKKFKEAFPKQHELLSLAKTQDEIDELQTRFVDEATVNLQAALKNSVADDKDQVPVDETAVVVLNTTQYDLLINARKGEIKNQLHVLIDALTRLQKLDASEIGMAIAIMAMNGMFAITMKAFRAAIKSAKIGADEVEAISTGVEALTSVTLFAVVTFVIMIVLIPIIFYMSKPANCVITLVNDLNDEIIFHADHAVHGKAKLMTSPIGNSVTLWEKGGIPVDENGNTFDPNTPAPDEPIVKKIYGAAGLIASAKSNQALVGSQYGFTFRYRHHHLSFGVENPLTSMYVDNNCFCVIGENAEFAAKRTNKHNKQEWHCTKDGITLEIRCNSGHGSTAYYVARAYHKK